MSEKHRVPDYLAPLTGWRYWSHADQDGQLHPIAHAGPGTLWIPGAPCQAICTCCGQPAKPTIENSIGMYSFKKVYDLYQQEFQSMYRSRAVPGERRALIIGQVWIWGRIVEHTAGYRSEFAYPKQLLIHLPGNTADPYFKMRREQLQELWNVPVEVGDFNQIIQKVIAEATKGMVQPDDDDVNPPF